MIAFSFNKNRIIRLHHGQRVRLVCGLFFVRTRHFKLNDGQFVALRCGLSRKTIIVSCGNNATISRGTIHLVPGQSIVVSC